ncbi:MAG: biopolymer transporter ExbD [Verrucomicrobia bacterium]|nr:biopolymer transporter ExbD [Verrucomicrobiota bacterium]
MARNFRRQRAAHPIADLNVTNLIDLGFMLLVIFMIATPLINQQEQTTRVNLPTIAKVPETKDNKDERYVAISVDAAGKFYLENAKSPVTLAELRLRLRGYAAEKKPPVIRIRGDGEGRYQKVAEIFGEVERAGLTRFTIDTQAK